MIEKFLNTYELKARVAPGLILALPIISSILYAAPALKNLPIFAVDGICTVALIYGLSHLVRARGRHIEPKLWSRWDGPPSTRYMRYRDTTFGQELKSSIRAELQKAFSIRLLGEDEEAARPGHADREIADAFRRVRPYLRQHDPDGLWSSHNAEYGFCRNLVACRNLWMLVALCATTFSVIYAWKTNAGLINAASVIGFLSLLASLYVGWAILPGATKRVAESYGESAWMAFLQVARDTPVVSPL